MITISDLKVSRETCLTELKDAEMMGHIIGGRFTPVLSGAFKFNLPFSIGQISSDFDSSGTIDADEMIGLFSGTFELSLGFEKKNQVSQPEHPSMDDCPEGM
ncbi:hypothetical protein [Moorena sp. SIO3I6]|uniref:hypothetical protein n=1 Tax=Moorena sp. SIO3I6 TaxID=2607831 RepID=UPI0013FB8307|nr:hypothetical protein [Moorena sp. SIO3I6]NEP27149.1 hypothetical protein [Moorena sp. SIO3I6]